jgi:hypothetical protein
VSPKAESGSLALTPEANLTNGTAYNVVNATIHLRQIVLLLKDPKLWCWIVTNAGFALATASIGSFLPTFINEFGFSPSIYKPVTLWDPMGRAD